MTPLAWLLGLFLPACGSAGAAGIPVPPPLDPAHFERPATPNTALAAPDGAGAQPDIVTPVFHVPATRLWATVQSVANGEPRTYRLAVDEAGIGGHLGGPQRGVELPRPGHRAGRAAGAGGQHTGALLAQRLRPIRFRREPPRAAKPGSPPLDASLTIRKMNPMRGLGPFLKDAWRLARPYFRSEEKWSARGCSLAIIALNLTLVGMTVVLNFWNREFYNALQNKDWEASSSCCSGIAAPTAD